MSVSSTESKEEHNKLFLRLNETFSHDSDNFKALQRAARTYLPKGTVQQCKDMDALAEKLQQGGSIKIGDYTVLKRMVRNANCNVDEIIEIIKETEQTIKGIEDQHEALAGKPASFDNTDTNSQTTVKQMATDPAHEIQSELGNHYKGTLSRLHPIPWNEFVEHDLDHVYTNLEMIPGLKEQISLRSSSDFGDIQKESRVFNSDLGERIVCLIDGPAGIGKSTLCRRFVHLWSKNNYSIDDHYFDIAFLLEAKLLTGNLKKNIKEQLDFPQDFPLSEDNIYDCVRNPQQKCLFIIDGVDELTAEGKTTVMEILKGNSLRHVNVLLTGRPEASRELVRHVNSHFRITGFSDENVEKYICKHFHRDKNVKDKLLKRLANDRQLKKIMTNPFTTMLVCSLVADRDRNISANLIDILMEVFDACYEKYVEKNKGSGMTLLSRDDLFLTAGQLAFNGIKLNITDYPEEPQACLCPHESFLHLLNSGILSKDCKKARLHLKSIYKFPHNLFQEYFGALYLAGLDLTELTEKCRELTVDMICSRNRNMLKYLLGMFENKERKRGAFLEILCQLIDKITNKQTRRDVLASLFDKVLESEKYLVLFGHLCEIIVKHCSCEDVYIEALVVYYLNRIMTPEFLFTGANPFHI